MSGTICNQPPLLGYQSALNGLRGIAVSLIFLFHCNIPGFNGTFLGVEIFFVLSGFLITTLLLEEHLRNGTISLKAFFIRRILRLAPALLQMLTGYLRFCFMYYQKSITRLHHVQDSLTVLFYIANWTRAFGLQRPDVLGHCWSLSIEEQFYMLWPMIFLLLLRQPHRNRSLAILGLIAISLGYRLYLLSSGAGWDRLYNDFGSRADMLLFGCLLASLRHDGNLARWSQSLVIPRVLAVLATTGLIILMAKADWQTSSLYQWQYTVAACCVALIILEVLCRPTEPLGKLLSLPLFTSLGTISYGVYLWHYPVIHFTGLISGYTGLQLVLLAGIITLLLAGVSWITVETPALRLKKRFISHVE